MSEAALFDSVVTANRCGIAAFTLVICEYLLHLPREVELFWKRRMTGASVLFLSNSCANLTNVIPAMTLLPYFPWAAFSGLRTYALCQRHLGLPLGILVFLLSCVPIGINFADYRWLTSSTDPTLGCLEGVAEPVQLRKQFTIGSRTCLIAADLIVLCVTWRATYQATRIARNGDISKHTFSETLLRDGTTYFLVLVTLNTLHLLFTVLSIASNAPIAVSYITIFTEPITSILVSRFILNLQEVNQSVAPELTSSTAGDGSIYFTKTRIIGALGSSLPFPSDTTLQNDWDEFEMDSCGLDQDGDKVADAARA